MYHIVYRTTNKLNGKIYVGSHSTENLNDGYLGSGRNIKRAIKKYGRDSFEVKHLFFCDSREKAFEVEEYAIRDHFGYYGNRKVYNAKDQACGHKAGETHPMWGKTHSDELRNKWSKERQGKGNQFYGKTHSEETKKRLSEVGSTKTGKDNNFYGRKHSEEAKKRISQNRKGICVGEAHPNHGKTFSEETRKRISETRKRLNLGCKPVFFRGQQFGSKTDAASTFFSNLSVNRGIFLINKELNKK